MWRGVGRALRGAVARRWLSHFGMTGAVVVSALVACGSAQAQPGRDTFIFVAPNPGPEATAPSKQKSRNRRQAPTAAAPTAEPAVKPKAQKIPTASTLPPPPRNPALAGVALDPSWPKQLFVISDSVMLGAKPALAKGLPDWQVNFMGRPALMIPKAIGELPGSVGSVAVVALGYNSLWYKDRKDFQRWADYFDKGAEDMLAALQRRGAKKIVWVMLRELSAELLPNNGTATMQYSKYSWYFPYVNERLRALKARHPELALADWVTAARQPGITYDAIHLNPKGAELMVDVVRMAVGLEPRPPRAITTAETPPPAEPPSLRGSDPLPTPPPDQTATVNKTPEPESPPVPVGPILKPTYAFRDCAACPEMVVIPAGSFMMGSPDGEADRSPAEGPQRQVTIPRPMAVGKFEVTFAEWEACVAGGGCQGNPSPGDEGWGKDKQPVINVSWDDAVEYVKWLSQKTGKTYRLLTEAEWEYAARAGTTSPFTTGATITPEQANFQTNFNEDGSKREGEYREQAIKVGTFPPNAFDLHDMHGNVWEWVADNWHDDYAGAPIDGSVNPSGDASMRVQRGGSWYSFVSEIRSASRHGDQPDHRGADIGFRVARGL